MNRDWKRQKIGEILRLEYGKPLPKDQRNPEGAFPVYGSNGVLAYSEKFYVDQPSIIVGRKGSAGELLLTESKFWPLDVTYFVVFNSEEFDLKFLFYMLKSLQLPNLAKGVKPGINRNDVYAIEVDIPPLPEQRRIVAKLDALHVETKKLEANYQKKLTDLEELRQSFLQKAFAGEL